MEGYKFPKKERICAKRDIELLFGKSKGVRLGVLSIRYTMRDRGEDPAAKVIFIVPKKRVRKAVDRNRLKRQLRELYRLHKVDWDKQNLPTEKTLLMAIHYFGEPKAVYSELEKQYIHAQKLLKAAVNKESINKN